MPKTTLTLKSQNPGQLKVTRQCLSQKVGKLSRQCLFLLKSIAKIETVETLLTCSKSEVPVIY